MLNPLEIEFEVTEADIKESFGKRNVCGECLVAKVLQRTLEDPDLEVGVNLVHNHYKAIYRLDRRGYEIRFNFDNYGRTTVGDKFSLEAL